MMRDWRETRGTDINVRVAGGVLIVLAYLSGSTLFGLRADLAAHDPRLVHFALAATAFLTGTAGTACSALGRRLFDRVEIARPWRSGDIAYLRPHPGDDE